MSTTAIAPAAPGETQQTIRLDEIVVGENVRPLDSEHVANLKRSIALRGLISPLTLRFDGERFHLTAGFHRHQACLELGLEMVSYTCREQEGSSADRAAENVVRKQLTALEEAHAIKAMLDDGYTADGAAEALGWSRRLVTERCKILDLPEQAQQLIGTGEIPTRAVDVLLTIQAASTAVCEATIHAVACGDVGGSQLLGSAGWVVGRAIAATGGKVFASYLNTVHLSDVGELRLGKKTTQLVAEAEKLHRQVTAHAYGPPSFEFEDADIDQARAAGVLLEFEDSTPTIIDRALYRELAKQVITRKVQQLRTAAAAKGSRKSSRGAGSAKRTPAQEADARHRASMRELTRQAHGTNLDLGSELIHKLATVDPASMDVARFFVYGLLGAGRMDSYGVGKDTAATIAANGIRLVIDEHRTTTTPRLKAGGWGKTKVSYGEIEDAGAWLWRFIDAAQDAGELYGRCLVVFASQHYARRLVLAASKRRGSALPVSRKDTARKAFERLTKSVLPDSHLALGRAIEREARRHKQDLARLQAKASEMPAADAEPDETPETDGEQTDPDAEHELAIAA
jgi:ParB/RepB/Spo0J family partition protein